MSERRQIYQCENCRKYLDYRPEHVDVNPTYFGAYQNCVGWCDECIANIKSKLSQPPQPTYEPLGTKDASAERVEKA